MAKGVGGWIEKPEDFKATATGIEYLDKAKNTALFGTEAAPGPIAKTLADAMVIWKGFQRIQVDVKPSDIIDYTTYGG